MDSYQLERMMGDASGLLKEMTDSIGSMIAVQSMQLLDTMWGKLSESNRTELTERWMGRLREIIDGYKDLPYELRRKIDHRAEELGLNEVSLKAIAYELAKSLKELLDNRWGCEFREAVVDRVARGVVEQYGDELKVRLIDAISTESAKKSVDGLLRDLNRIAADTYRQFLQDKLKEE